MTHIPPETEGSSTLTGEERLDIAWKIVDKLAEFSAADALTILILALAITGRMSAADTETYDKLVLKIGTMLADAPVLSRGPGQPH